VNRKDAELIYDLVTRVVSCAVVGLHDGVIHPDSAAQIRKTRKEFFATAIDADEAYMEVRKPTPLEQRRETVKDHRSAFLPRCPGDLRQHQRRTRCRAQRGGAGRAS
jgi:hypothetical protein